MPTRKPKSESNHAVKLSKLQDLLKNIQESANHMHGEWEGGHIRFSSPQDQKRHAQKNYERICKLIKEAYIILDT